MKRSTTLLLLLLFSMLLYAACGDEGSSSDSSSSSSSSSSSASTDNSGQAIPTPTQMSGSFQAVGEQSVLTDTAELLETQQTTETTTTGDSAVAGDASVGERSYAKNKCADCHGSKGEGIADKGKAIAGTSLSFDDFAKVVRTGNGLGNTHIFGPSAVSPKGMEGLYAYVKGLK